MVEAFRITTFPAMCWALPFQWARAWKL